MTNEVGTTSPVEQANEQATGRFRPESLSHFKEVAKNMAWLLERPVQKCQEDLARIWGYSGLHELQQVLKRPGPAGPFEPRYNYLGTDNEALVEGHEQRILHILFGVPKHYWRSEDAWATDEKGYLVFEMGLFQEAAEHRACVEKIKLALTYDQPPDTWPLINGWPLGLRSWLAARYTEPLSLADGWQAVLPPSRYVHMEHANLQWQRRTAGLARLATMFQILAPRVQGQKPAGMGQVDFSEFEDDGGGLRDSSWESYCLREWLLKKHSHGRQATTSGQGDLVQAFIERPSRATAAACEFVADLKDPVAFRDRWAFEAYKAALTSYPDRSQGLYSSTLADGAIQSLLLHADCDCADIGRSDGCQLWRLDCTWSEVAQPANAGGRPTVQPVIHATGSLIVPYNDDLVCMTTTDWYFCHDASEFSSETAAWVFDKVYLPAVGVKSLDFTYREGMYSIIEIEEVLLSSTVTVEVLRAYFGRLLRAFDAGCLPESYGGWCETLGLTYYDRDENESRNENGNYADYIYTPAVLLIAVQGCGLTSVEATSKSGKRVSSLKPSAKKGSTPEGKELAAKILQATKGLDVDVVVYDGSV